MSRIQGLALCATALGLVGCSGSEVKPDKKPVQVAIEGCTAESLKTGMSPFLIDEASSDLRTKLEAVLAVRDIAIVSASCDKGVEVLEGCTVRGDYNFVGLTPENKTLIMKDQAQAQANLGFGVGESLDAAFAGGKELVVQYRLIGKYKTTIPGVKRERIKDIAICQGATHFVTSIDVGAFSSFAAERNAFKAGGSFDGFSGSGGASSEATNTITAGSLAACPDNAETLEPPAGCSASIRVSLAPIEEATAQGPESAKKRASDCRDGFVFNDDGVCVSKASTPIYVCDPYDFEECFEMCTGKDGVFSKKSCSRLADLSMNVIDLILQDDEQRTKSLSDILQELVEDEENGFARFVAANGPKFQQICQTTEVGEDSRSGDTCALGFVNLFLIDEKEEDAQKLYDLYDMLDRGCRAGEQFTCEMIESFLLEGVEDEEDSWKEMYERHGVKNRSTQFVRVMTRSCRNGNGRSCFRLSKEHVNGETAILDLALAADYAERGCNAGLSHACIASGAMKLGNATVCNEVLAKYTAKSDTQNVERDEDNDVDAWHGSMVIDATFARKICLKSGLGAETEDVTISSLRGAFELFLAGCDLKDKTACGVSFELYEEIVEREIERIEILEDLNNSAGGSDE